jgi:hypothetical protein
MRGELACDDEAFCALFLVVNRRIVAEKHFLTLWTVMAIVPSQQKGVRHDDGSENDCLSE